MEGTTTAQPPLGEPKFALNTDLDSRWCLRCLKWFTGKTKDGDGKYCEDPNFTCDHDDQGNCQRCKKLGKRRSEFCMMIPPSHWNRAKRAIERHRTILNVRRNDPNADVSADISAVASDVAAVLSSTENHYRQRGQLQAESHFLWGSSIDRPRRDLPPVDYSLAPCVDEEDQAIEEPARVREDTSSSEDANDKAGPSVARSCTAPAATRTPSILDSRVASPRAIAAPVFPPLPAGPVGTLRSGRSAGLAIDTPNSVANFGRVASGLVEGANEPRVMEALNEVRRLRGLYDNACLQLGEAVFEAACRGNHRG